MTPDYSRVPSWIQQGTNDDNSWMPVPMPAPTSMMDFNTFDPAYNFAWPDPSSNLQNMASPDLNMDGLNWNDMDWSSLRGNDQGWEFRQ